MKLTAFALALMPGIVFASSWTSQGFPPFTAEYARGMSYPLSFNGILAKIAAIRKA